MALSTEVHVLRQGPTNPDGKVFGTIASDAIAFYGATAVVQAVGNAQAALGRGVAGGIVATAGSTNTPTSIPVQATSEVLLTLNQTLSQVNTGFWFQMSSTTDFVIPAKPTQQAGLAVGSARIANATQVAVTFANFTTATISATAGEKYGFVAIRGIPATTVTITPAVVSASTTNEQIFTVPGIRVGEAVALNVPSNVTNVTVGNVRVAGNNQVAVTFVNTSPSTATTPPAGSYVFFSTGGIDTVNNVFAVQAGIGSGLPGPVGTAVSSFSYTVTGLATTDQVVGLSKPTQQTGLMYGTAFVAAANVLGVSYTENAATVTPTANELYGLTVFRPAPAAPCIIYTPTLSPAAVAPNTTSSQAFTLTGLINSSVVFVNKAASQVGMTIMGARVSGTNQLEITFANATANTITPTAGEVYTVANFQQPVPDAGNAFIFQASPQQQQMAVLTNAIRAALAGTGLIAGA